MLYIPKIREREELIKNKHIDLGHRSAKYIFEELKKEYNWSGLLQSI